MRVFISYSWDDDQHKAWVLWLAESLIQDGIDVVLDRYELRPGKSIQQFIEPAIDQADKIIVIFTPNYKIKAENRKGGVGYEYSILNQALYERQDKSNIIPILRSGNTKESIPIFMRQYIHIDFSNDNLLASSYKTLITELYDEPEYKKPLLGKKPDFLSTKHLNRTFKAPAPVITPDYTVIKQIIEFQYLSETQFKHSKLAEILVLKDGLDTIKGSFSWTGSDFIMRSDNPDHSILSLQKTDNYENYEVKLNRKYLEGDVLKLSFFWLLEDIHKKFIPFISIKVKNPCDYICLSLNSGIIVDIDEVYCDTSYTQRPLYPDEQFSMKVKFGRASWEIHNPNLLYNYQMRWRV